MFKFRKTGAFVIGMVLSITVSSTSAFAADYTVLKNDSLYKIGRLFNTSVNTIKSTNHLKSNQLRTGQVVKVKAKIYKIKKGDTLYSIAKKNKVTLASLRRANNKWNDKVKPAQKLLLPAANTTAKKAAVKSSKVAPAAKTFQTSMVAQAADQAPNSSKASISYTKNELDLLARLITAEATGQPYDAMVGVGAVVVNRVQSSVWPDSISSVINQVAGGYYQFTPVKNGYIKKPASKTAIKAAKAALNGSDPSYNAMFYFDDTSTNSWLWSKPITARYGIMVFVK
ncbi:LysM peptidoglycan-binding domain-containing protein [Anaerocolumna sp. AGMB13025]|uniref:cell wall hydrolase n=1 Tax=Anaerocolumna sp. AGMB13025 TaxID=3039116 RepID=UPI00241F3532|nr:cell wall hydrolase [Anaerocolumna sp. AGMB13025]WFR59298.1 LysM peptidoglycan-binding domain-containing protein [Anaerocolumna sp. AGMB13025]